ERYSGPSQLRRAEFLCGEIEGVLPCLEASATRFDFIMDDAAYAEPLARCLPTVLRLARLLRRRGVLVMNRYAHDTADETAATLRDHFARVTVRRVRKSSANVLFAASLPRARAASSARRTPPAAHWTPSFGAP